MEFSNWLKLRLHQRGIKPSELAHRSGLSGAEVSRLLSGLRKPSAKTIQKIAPALHATEEELLRASGILPPEKEKPKTIELPVRGECPADKFNFACEEIIDTLEINFDMVKDRSAFALRVKGDCLHDIGIYNNDLVIVSPNAEVKNGDIVIARIGDECTMKKFYRTDHTVLFEPCNHNYPPIILNPKEKRIEIIGKVIKALKSF